MPASDVRDSTRHQGKLSGVRVRSPAMLMDVAILELIAGSPR